MPIIGITPVSEPKRLEYAFSYYYPELVVEANGTPLLLPLTNSLKDLETYCNLCDGFIFSGGSDINPKLYKQNPHPQAGPYDDLRDYMETNLLKMAIRKNKPCFGICRGMQLMNVVNGGTLIQDIVSLRPSKVKHLMSQPYENKFAHTIDIISGSLLENVFSCKQLLVNSIHHQAIDKLAANLEILALAEDNIIEAIVNPSLKFFVGVQWHPEYCFKTDTKNLDLVKYFINQC